MRFRTGTRSLKILLYFFERRGRDKLFVASLLSCTVGTSNKYIPNLKFACIFMNIIIFQITFFYFKKVNTNELTL